MEPEGGNENPMGPPKFIPGLELARTFFVQEVQPILKREFPGLSYSAALIGSGSEVLGFDTPMSTDHHWGPRVQLFLQPEENLSCGKELSAYLEEHLPSSCLGYSTNFSPPDLEDHGVQHMVPSSDGSIHHRVELLTLGGFFRSYLNLDLSSPLSHTDWLSLPSHKLLSIVAGEIFHDDLGLKEVRNRFSWYPRDVWLYLLGSAWVRIGQEEHFMGRAGQNGDEVGSALIGARLVRDIMRIGFLLERRYPPYAKWFGQAFSHLSIAAQLLPSLKKTLQAQDWREREIGLSTAYEVLLKIQQSQRISDPLIGKVEPFHGRPFLVIQGGRIAEAVFSQIENSKLLSLSRQRPIGSIDLISDNTDVLEDVSLRPALTRLYQ